MTITLPLSKFGSFVFGLNSSPYAMEDDATCTDKLPLTEPESLTRRTNITPYDTADTREYESVTYSAGEWAEGSVSPGLIPGSVTNLLSWIQDRNDDNQGVFATCAVDFGHGEYKKIYNAKVKTAVFTFRKGEPVTVRLDIVGQRMVDAVYVGSPDMPVPSLYLFKEATVGYGSTGGAYPTTYDFEQIEITIDNGVEDPAEGLRLAPYNYPYVIYNLYGMRITGTAQMDFANVDAFDAFMASYSDIGPPSSSDRQLRIALARGANTCTLTLPRIQFENVTPALAGDHSSRIVLPIEFRGLADEATGATAPLTLA